MKEYGSLKIRKKVHPRKYKNSETPIDIPIFSCLRDGKRIRLKKLFDNIYTDSHDETFLINISSGEEVQSLVSILKPVIKNIMAKNITIEVFLRKVCSETIYGIKDYSFNNDTFRFFYLNDSLTSGCLIKNSVAFYSFDEK